VTVFSAETHIAGAFAAVGADFYFSVKQECSGANQEYEQKFHKFLTFLCYMEISSLQLIYSF
jgi:hypothetical protein